MLDSVVLALTLTCASPNIAEFDIYKDRPYDYYDQLIDEYPGLENFWSTDIQGIWFKNTCQCTVARGDGDGDKTDYTV